MSGLEAAMESRREPSWASLAAVSGALLFVPAVPSRHTRSSQPTAKMGGYLRVYTDPCKVNLRVRDANADDGMTALEPRRKSRLGPGFLRVDEYTQTIARALHLEHEGRF